jgi:F0F1-type ATP synthase assembly protein I
VSPHAVEAALIGFIAGVAVTAVIGWFLRERIKARMIRRRRDG